MEYFQWDYQFPMKYLYRDITNYYNDGYYISNNFNLVLFQLINPNSFILEFKEIDYGYIFDYELEEIKEYKDILNMKYYKDISTGYFYSPKKTLIFIFKKRANFQVVGENRTSNNITDSYNIFKIAKDEEISFNVTFPSRNIILKSLTSNQGEIKIYDNYYYFYEENQIEEINAGYLTTLTIKAINNYFIFAIKTKVDENLIINMDIGNEYNNTIKNNEIFIIYDLDYINYDYAFFSLSFEPQDKDIYYGYSFLFGVDIGLLNQSEISTKKGNSWEYFYYCNFKYYKNKRSFKNKKLFIAFYFKSYYYTFDIKLESEYYKQLVFEDFVYKKNWGNDLMTILDTDEKFILYFYSETGLSLVNYIHGYGESQGTPSLKPYESSRVKYFCPVAYRFYGYILKIPLNSSTRDICIYSYNYIDKIKTINNTHFEIYFDHYFTNVKEKNFILILKDYDVEEDYESKFYILENYYLKNETGNDLKYDIFSLNGTDCDYRCAFYLPMSKTYNLSEYNRKNIFYLIGESYPYKLVYVYDPFIYTTEEKIENNIEKNVEVNTESIAKDENEYEIDDETDNENNSQENINYNIMKTIILIPFFILL